MRLQKWSRLSGIVRTTSTTFTHHKLQLYSVHLLQILQKKKTSKKKKKEAKCSSFLFLTRQGSRSSIDDLWNKFFPLFTQLWGEWCKIEAIFLMLSIMRCILLALWLPTIPAVGRLIQKSKWRFQFNCFYGNVFKKNCFTLRHLRLKTQKLWIFCVNWWFMNQFICLLYTIAGGWCQIEAIFWGGGGALKADIEVYFICAMIAHNSSHRKLDCARLIQNGGCNFGCFCGEVCPENWLQFSVS